MPVSKPSRRGNSRTRQLSVSTSPHAGQLDDVIHTVRNERVILDADLAAIYGVKTKVLNQAVRRNRGKFPSDFLLELTNAEAANLQHTRRKGDTILRSQIVTLRHGRHIKHRPFAFTEHGALMAANVLNSPQATSMSVFVIRAFVKLRALVSNSTELAAELKKLEAKLTARIDNQDAVIAEVLQRIMQLIDPPPAPAISEKELGFHTLLPKP